MTKQQKYLLAGAGICAVAYFIVSSARKTEEKRRKENPTVKEAVEDNLTEAGKFVLLGPLGYWLWG